VTYARAVALLGVTDGALLDDMVDALAAGDAAAVYGTVDRVVEAGHDPRRFASDLLERFRDLIVLDAVPDAPSRGLIDVPDDQLTHMTDQAVRLGGGTLTRYAEIVHTALLEMRGTTSPRLVLELLCARMQLPDASTDSAALLQRLERLERRATLTSGSASPAPEAAPAPESAPSPRPVAQHREERRPQPPPPPPQAPASAPAVPADPPAASAPAPSAPAPAAPPAAPGQLDAAALRRLWPEVLEIVKQSSRRARALLDNAQITAATGDSITVAAPAALARMIADDSNTSILRAALTKVVGGTWKVTVEPEGAGGAAGDNGGGRPGPAAPAAPPTAPPPEPDPRDDADYDPTPAAAAPASDPEAEAVRLLQSQLGARPIDQP
jgi:DNA polymerase-3 subunit gamma/tau